MTRFADAFGRCGSVCGGVVQRDTSGACCSGDCTPSGATVTCVFTYTGGEQTFVVPANASIFEATASGAARGSTSLPGGRGARVSAALTSVKPADTLSLEVGGAGTSVDSFNGGANPGFLAGGGASDVRTLSRNAVNTLASRLLVAGGGGGVADGCATPTDEHSGQWRSVSRQKQGLSIGAEPFRKRRWGVGVPIPTGVAGPNRG